MAEIADSECGFRIRTGIPAKAILGDFAVFFLVSPSQDTPLASLPDTADFINLDHA